MSLAQLQNILLFSFADLGFLKIFVNISWMFHISNMCVSLKSVYLSGVLVFHINRELMICCMNDSYHLIEGIWLLAPGRENDTPNFSFPPVGSKRISADASKSASFVHNCSSQYLVPLSHHSPTVISTQLYSYHSQVFEIPKLETCMRLRMRQ